MLKKLKKGSKEVNSVKNVINGPKWAPKAPRNFQIFHRLAGPASRQPGQAEIGQAGGWPIGPAGRLTSLYKTPSFYIKIFSFFYTSLFFKLKKTVRNDRSSSCFASFIVILNH